MSDIRDPIECARAGDLDFFKTVDVEVFRSAKTSDEYGYSVLSKAAAWGHVDCCEEILKKCPELLYQKNRRGATALHHAVYNGQANCVKLILSWISKDAGIQNRIDGSLLTATDNVKESALHNAVLKDYLECAKLLIEADSSKILLRMANNKGDTAMHIAVTKHNLEIVKLLGESDSNWNYPANNSGHAPFQIAFQEALVDDPRAVEIRKLFIEKLPDECNVRTGPNNWSILHHAVNKGNLGLVQNIFQYCPACIELLDNEGRNFLHLAAKFQHVDIVKFTLSITSLPAGVLNGQDNSGDTPLHIAALGGQSNVVIPLLYDSRINKLFRNKQGHRAVDMIHFEYDMRKAGVYGLTNKLGEKEIKDQSDFDLVVGALIAAASFSAAITVPGGYFADGPNKGTAILANKSSFKVFEVANISALLLSLYAVFCHFCAKRFFRQKDVIYQLQVATYCSLGAIFAMVGAVIARSYAVLVTTGEFAIFICVLCCFFFLCASRPLWKMISQNILKHHLD